jgi:hypothetical protein
LAAGLEHPAARKNLAVREEIDAGVITRTLEWM